jgi:hypothetical protein
MGYTHWRGALYALLLSTFSLRMVLGDDSDLSCSATDLCTTGCCGNGGIEGNE